MVKYTDHRHGSVDFEPNGNLYVKYDEVNIENNFRLKYAKEGDVGLDLPVIIDKRLKVKPSRDYYVNFKEGWFDIPPSGIAEIPCGLAIKVPDDAWGNIKPRSSTSWRKGLVVNEAVIDAGYTGPIFILVSNPNNEPVRVTSGDRLAQLILIPKYPTKQIIAVSYLPKTERASTGFGSSGGLSGDVGEAPIDMEKSDD